MSDVAAIDSARLARIRAAVGAGEPGTGHRVTERVPPPWLDETESSLIEPAASEMKWRAPDLAAEIARLSTMPWIELRLGESVVTRARVGMVIALMGPTGSGKSSNATQMVTYHARHVGPVVYASLELDADVLAGRIAGETLGASWAGVMTLAEVTAADVARVLAELPRLMILDGDRADLANIERAVAMLRAEYPGEPVIVVIDYVQIAKGEGREERVRIAQITESIRRMAQRLGVVVIMVSQTSRASAQGLRNGDVVGVDTTTTGAESAQIERAASVTLAIGSLVEREDGTLAADISIGKSRMGGGDKVLPAVYDGRTGNWTITGPVVSGADKRAERAEQKDEARVDAARFAIPARLAAAAGPMTRDELVGALAMRATSVKAAVRSLLADPDGTVVEVRVAGRKKTSAWPVWTRDRAMAAPGVDIVPTAIGGGS